MAAFCANLLGPFLNSTYPCVFCNMAGKDFEEDIRTLRFGGKLRDMGHLRKQSTKYQEALKTYRGSGKLSSAFTYSVERRPICESEPDSTRVIDICVPVCTKYLLTCFF